MGRWGLIVEENRGSGDSKVWAPRVLAHVDGTREQAFAQLESWAKSYKPEHPRSPGRRLVYRHAEGFMTVTEGYSQEYHCRFSVLELLYDSEAPEAPEAPESVAPQRPEDRVPPGY